MLIIRYVLALWKRKTLGQLISLLYITPTFIIIICTVLQMLMPVASSIIFETNSNYTYMYSGDFFTVTDNGIDISNDAVYFLNSDDAATYLYKPFVISSKYDNTFIVDGHPFSEINKLDNLYIAMKEKELSFGLFTRKNLITRYNTSNNVLSTYPEIYISYNSARILEVAPGDKIIVKVNKGYIECQVSGILRPNYEDLSYSRNWLDYTEVTSFPALLIVDEITFYDIANGHHDISVRVFTNKEFVPNSFDMYLKASKINSYKELLMSSSLITRLASQVLMIAAVLIIVIQLEYGFTQKKNAKDIEVLAKLGMNKKQISLTLTTHVCIVCFICLILASLICRFIYFDILIDMYCETLVYLITYLLLAMICILILVIRYIFAKKYYSSF
jgi:hypothetical protein